MITVLICAVSLAALLTSFKLLKLFCFDKWYNEGYKDANIWHSTGGMEPKSYADMSVDELDYLLKFLEDRKQVIEAQIKVVSNYIP